VDQHQTLAQQAGMNDSMCKLYRIALFDTGGKRLPWYMLVCITTIYIMSSILPSSWGYRAVTKLEGCTSTRPQLLQDCGYHWALCWRSSLRKR